MKNNYTRPLIFLFCITGLSCSSDMNPEIPAGWENAIVVPLVHGKCGTSTEVEINAEFYNYYDGIFINSKNVQFPCFQREVEALVNEHDDIIDVLFQPKDCVAADPSCICKMNFFFNIYPSANKNYKLKFFERITCAEKELHELGQVEVAPLENVTAQ